VESNNQKFECHVTLGSDQGVVEPLVRASSLSGNQIKQAMTKGAVWWRRGSRTERVRRASRVLRKGDEVFLYYNEQILSESPTPCLLVSDEADYSVWYKPYGVRSQGSKWGDHCTLHRWSEQNLKPERPAFTVHRLDRAATGLMLIAHKKRVATQLATLFERREVEKRYVAIVHGAFPSGPPQTIEEPVDGKEAVSHVTLLMAAARSLVAVTIETGRKHQIRRHLSHLGYPIVGDRLHGLDGDEENMQLRAVELAFTCPVSGEKRRYSVPAEIPDLDPSGG